MGLVIGIDASTTATKAILVDEAGAVRGIGSAAYELSVPRPLWSEQEPQLWWDGTVTAIRAVLAETGVHGDEVAAVGLTGQMHGAVLLDRDDEVLRPAILWNDQRTGAECDLIREVIGPERLVAITGNDALTGFTAPKLVWVRDHEPDVWARVAHVLLPKDYVRLRLTGDHAMDKADGSGTMLFDLAARDWSREVLDALRIDPAWMPPTYEGPQVTGTLTAAAAAATGLRAGTPVVAGRRRPGGERGRRRRRGTRRRRALARNLRGHLRDDRPAALRGEGPGPCLLPRRPGPLAHDVGDAVGCRQPALVSATRWPPARRTTT